MITWRHVSQRQPFGSKGFDNCKTRPQPSWSSYNNPYFRPDSSLEMRIDVKVLSKKRWKLLKVIDDDDEDSAFNTFTILSMACGHHWQILLPFAFAQVRSDYFKKKEKAHFLLCNSLVSLLLSMIVKQATNRLDRESQFESLCLLFFCLLLSKAD